MLDDRLFRQVNRGWVLGLRLLVLGQLSLGVASRFDVAAGRLLSIPGNETPEEPRMIRSGP